MDDVKLVFLDFYCLFCELISSMFLIYNIFESFVIGMYGKFFIGEIDVIRLNFF